jgi:hypothetical protein
MYLTPLYQKTRKDFSGAAHRPGCSMPENVWSNTNAENSSTPEIEGSE